MDEGRAAVHVTEGVDHRVERLVIDRD